MRGRLATLAFVALGIFPAAASAHATRPFIQPRPRPTEALERPGEGITPSRTSYTVPEAPASPDCDVNFCVHWVDKGLDAPNLKDTNGDGVPDYVERILAIAEHVHSVENGKLGWKEPLSDGALGGGHGETDIYLAEIGGELFGYAAPDRDQAVDGRQPRHLHGYLVLDNDYSPFEFPGTEPGHDIKVTLAHEYNHILQFGYDAYEDPWFAESTAVWMEDQVYNGINDYLRYVRRWVKLWQTPLTANSIKEYGSAVWNQWLARHYGRAIIREAWAGADTDYPDGFSVAAYERAIHADGPSSFGRDFTRFAADVAEWRTGIGFRESYLYPDMPRQGNARSRRAPVDPPAQPHHLQPDRSPRPHRSGGRSDGGSAGRDRRGAGAGRADRLRTARPHGESGRLRAGGRQADRDPRRPGPLPADHRGRRQRRRQRLGLQRPPPRLALPDRPDPVRDQRSDRPLKGSAVGSSAEGLSRRSACRWRRRRCSTSPPSASAARPRAARWRSPLR